MKKKMGFTLIELLAAVVILGILSAVATIAISRITKNSRKTALLSEISNYVSAQNYNKMLTNDGESKNIIDPPSEIENSSYDYKSVLLEVKNGIVKNGLFCLTKGSDYYYVNFLNNKYEMVDVNNCDLIDIIKPFSNIKLDSISINSNEQSNLTDYEAYLYSDSSNEISMYYKNNKEKPENNKYVSFANMEWLILKVTKDNYVLITKEPLYGRSFTYDEVKDKLNEWYNSLSNSDKGKITNKEFNYYNVSYTRNEDGTYNMSYSKSDVFNHYVGLPTMEEIFKREENIFKENTDDSSWKTNVTLNTLNYDDAYILNKDDDGVYVIDDNFQIVNDSSRHSIYAVIYIDSTKYKLDGAGTESNPYIIDEKE